MFLHCFIGQNHIYMQVLDYAIHIREVKKIKKLKILPVADDTFSRLLHCTKRQTQIFRMPLNWPRPIKSAPLRSTVFIGTSRFFSTHIKLVSFPFNMVWCLCKIQCHFSLLKMRNSILEVVFREGLEQINGIPIDFNGLHWFNLSQVSFLSLANSTRKSRYHCFVYCTGFLGELTSWI